MSQKDNDKDYLDLDIDSDTPQYCGDDSENNSELEQDKDTDSSKNDDSDSAVDKLHDASEKSDDDDGDDGPDNSLGGNHDANDSDEVATGSTDKESGEDDEDDDEDGDDENGENKEDDSEVDDKIKDTAMLAGAQIATQGAQMLAFQMMMRQLLSMVIQIAKTVLEAVLGAISSVISSVVSFIVSVGSTVVSCVSGLWASVTSFVGSVFSVGTTAASTITATATVSVMSLSAMGVAATVSSQVMMVDSGYCSVEETTLESEGDATDTSGQTLLNAQATYSVLTTYGLANNNIAGVLGNWAHESGIDPTSIEGIFGDAERHSATGPRKSAAFADLHDYTLNTLFPSYTNGGINQSGYVAGDGKYYPGLGLGQWTGPRAKLLIDYSSGVSRNWYELDTQLAFMLGADSRSSYFSNWADESSPESAADSFMSGWEGISNSNGSLDSRKSSAVTYALLLESWNVDTVYANTIIGMAGATANGGTNDSIAGAYDDCVTAEPVYDNSSLALAAVMYAHETQLASTGNHGTPLYQYLHDEIFPTSIYYMSCDISVATAIRWSGADDNFPGHAITDQDNYLNGTGSASGKWVKIPHPDSEDGLQPGDIMLVSRARSNNERSHIVMYVGNEAVKQVFPNAPDNYVMVSGSLGTRSPGVGPYSSSYNSDYDYEVWRCTSYETNPQYKNIHYGFSG